MMNEFFRQLANTANNFFWNVHLSFYPEKKKKIQRIQDDIFLTEKTKKIAIGAYKKELYLNLREDRMKNE
ncbi:hypothetical protein [Liquorilactobacillus satsumensis]|uniref:hypothetical protein n=1 Tax=Liquorilactobacillus satsumensis TaxID=259059 RepID=UPI0039ECB6AA